MTKVILFGVLLLNSVPPLAADNPHIVAASNMTQALTEIADEFKREKGITVKLSFGSSGNYARQIIQGAPFKLFLAADKKYIGLLTENSIAIDAYAPIARGRIGFFIPHDSRLEDYQQIDGVVKSLFRGQYRRIAIANPEHAPFGLAAKQALQSAGVWAIEKDKLLIGESAAQAMQFTLSGGVDLGIVPASYAYSPEIAVHGTFHLIPENWHQPIEQYIALLKGADKITKQFYTYLQSKTAQKIIEKYGYTVNIDTREVVL